MFRFSTAFSSGTAPPAAPETFPPAVAPMLTALVKSLSKHECNVDALTMHRALRPVMIKAMNSEWALPEVYESKTDFAKQLSKAEKKVAGAKALGLDVGPEWEEQIRMRKNEAQAKQRRDDLKLTEDQVVRPEFKCPITLEKMVDPVLASDGHTYERSAIERILRTTGISPMSRQHISHITPNHAMKSMIASYEEDLLKLCEARQEKPAKLQRTAGGKSAVSAGKPASSARKPAAAASSSANSKRRTQPSKKRSRDDDESPDWCEGDD
eukprot:Transcript_8664.p1 GENE.Transcript_8664~~Transcript_8664.p1  ORF type:complete len:295 (-),score=88.44 Transcript_8664:180-983(-)